MMRADDGAGSLVDEIFESLSHCTPEIRPYILDNVFVHGVASKVNGLDARLFNELVSALPHSLTPTMTNLPEYMPETAWAHASWTGAALLAKVIFSSNQHISKSDYNENGPAVAHRGR
jgi:actin-related protein 7